MKKINTKKKKLLITKILETTTIVGIVIIIGFILNLLYKNLYLVSTKYSEVVELQYSKRAEIVNITNFNKILEDIKNKTEQKNIEEIYNPFN